jgi:4-diphosphocytidyl-2-C-methyl-D-erythritol kinase
MITELAPAKANLVLQVGPRRADGLHEICSLFASLELADVLHVEPLVEPRGRGPGGGRRRPSDLSGRGARGDRGGSEGTDLVECPGVRGPNFVTAALAAYRAAPGAADLPSLRVRVEKRIPVAAGLGGGSADAAAALRVADRLAGSVLGADRLREIAMRVGADVPSQVEPGHALVTGAGERVEPVDLPPLALALVPQAEGLSTGRVYAEADRRGDARRRLAPEALRALVRSPSASPEALLAALENDLEPAARALRPELAEVDRQLRAAGARATLQSGSGPTMLGVFATETAARAAAREVEGAIATRLRARAPTAEAPSQLPSETGSKGGGTATMSGVERPGSGELAREVVGLGGPRAQ